MYTYVYFLSQVNTAYSINFGDIAIKFSLRRKK